MNEKKKSDIAEMSLAELMTLPHRICEAELDRRSQQAIDELFSTPGLTAAKRVKRFLRLPGAKWSKLLSRRKRALRQAMQEFATRFPQPSPGPSWEWKYRQQLMPEERLKRRPADRVYCGDEENDKKMAIALACRMETLGIIKLTRSKYAKVEYGHRSKGGGWKKYGSQWRMQDYANAGVWIDYTNSELVIETSNSTKDHRFSLPRPGSGRIYLWHDLVSVANDDVFAVVGKDAVQVYRWDGLLIVPGKSHPKWCLNLSSAP